MIAEFAVAVQAGEAAASIDVRKAFDQHDAGQPAFGEAHRGSSGGAQAVAARTSSPVQKNRSSIWPVRER